MTGLSGSGKSSLAFDTIYAEGQRRYVESLSAYARQFLQLMEKPDVDAIDGLSPAISIEQKNHFAESALHRWHSYRNPRLPAASVRTDRCALLSCHRQADRKPDCPADDRQNPCPAQRHTPAAIGSHRARTQRHMATRTTRTTKTRIPTHTSQWHHPYDRRSARSRQKNAKHNLEVVVDRIVVADDLGPTLTRLTGNRTCPL